MSKTDELKAKNENLFERNTVLLNENERLKKENEQLKAQIENMKCCGNCSHRHYWGNELDCNLDFDKQFECDNNNKKYWEFKEG